MEKIEDQKQTNEKEKWSDVLGFVESRPPFFRKNAWGARNIAQVQRKMQLWQMYTHVHRAIAIYEQ